MAHMLSLLRQYLLNASENRYVETELSDYFKSVDWNAETFKAVLDVFNDSRFMRYPDLGFTDILQVGGTGGDTLKTINVSTISAMTVASLGCKLIKTGSKAHTGNLGSYDFFWETAEILDFPSERFKDPKLSLEKYNFYFASVYDAYPWMNEIMSVRRIFSPDIFNKIFESMDRNEMGSAVKIDGIASEDIDGRLNHYIDYGYKKILIYHGYSDESGIFMDEVSNLGATQMGYCINSEKNLFTIYPHQFRKKERIGMKNIMVNGREEALQKGIDIIIGRGDDKLTDLICINASVFYNFLNDFSLNFDEIYAMIHKHVTSGLVYKHFKD